MHQVGLKRKHPSPYFAFLKKEASLNFSLPVGFYLTAIHRKQETLHLISSRSLDCP